jgi:hypothetical protein
MDIDFNEIELAVVVSPGKSSALAQFHATPHRTGNR